MATHQCCNLITLYFILLMLNVLKRQWWLVVTLVKIHTRPSPWNVKFLTFYALLLLHCRRMPGYQNWASAAILLLFIYSYPSYTFLPRTAALMTLYCFQLCRVLRCWLSTSNLGARRDIMLLMLDLFDMGVGWRPFCCSPFIDGWSTVELVSKWNTLGMGFWWKS